MTWLSWGDLTREQIGAVANQAVAILPVGAVEQHGRHLPTKTDFFVAAQVARAAAEKVPDHVTALLLPAMPFGFSEHHVPFGGTLSVSSETLVAVLVDLLRSLRRAGVERALIVNGHGGNTEICGLVAKRAAIEHDMVVAAASYWLTLDQGADVPGHAGAFETSIMLHLAPELVVREELTRSASSLLAVDHPGTVVEDPRQWRSLGGWTDDPGRAVAEDGARLLDTAAGELAKMVVRLAGRRSSEGGDVRPILG